MTSGADSAAGQADGDADPRALAGSPLYRRTLIALFCAGIAAFAQIYGAQAVLPDIAAYFGISESESSWAVGATTIGVAVGLLPWARLSDRIGRAPAMRLALCFGLVFGVAAPFIPHFGWFIAARFAEGLALAAVPAIAVTAIAETVHPRALGGAVGTYVAGNTIGGLLGRVIAGSAADPLGWRGGLAVVAGLAAIATVVFLIRMPATVVPTGGGVPMLRGLLANLRRPGVMVLVAQSFLLMGGFVALYNYLAFRLQEPPFELSLAQISWLFLAYLAGAVASRWAWRFTTWMSPTGVVLTFIGLMLAGLALTLTHWLIAVIVGLVLFTGAFFGAHTIASGLVSRRAEQARSLAPPLYSLGYYAGSSAIGWLGGVCFAVGGWGGAVALVAAVTLLAGLLAWGYARPRGGVRHVDG